MVAIQNDFVGRERRLSILESLFEEPSAFLIHGQIHWEDVLLNHFFKGKHNLFLRCIDDTESDDFQYSLTAHRRRQNPYDPLRIIADDDTLHRRKQIQPLYGRFSRIHLGPILFEERGMFCPRMSDVECLNLHHVSE